MARQRQPRACKKCGESGLFWKSFNGSWRLSKPDGDLHECPEFRPRFKPQPPEFPQPGPKAEPQPVDAETFNGEPRYTEPQPTGGNGDAGAVLWGLIGPHAQQSLGPAIAARLAESLKQLDTESITEQVCATALERLAKSQTVNVYLTAQPEQPPVTLTQAHKQTAKLIKRLSLGLNVMLTGPAGSGKTHAAEQAAAALGLAFYAMSVGPQTSKTDLLGYVDAHGKYITTAFREAFEHGGLFLLDEMDAGNAGVLTILNSATSNGHCSFPDSPQGIRKHADFRCIAAANTFGNGADRQYVGRNQLDGATLDRFVKMAWEYDRALERELSGNVEWCEYVHALRDAQQATGCRVILSLRAISNGARMLAAGIDRDEVEAETLWNGIAADDKAKLLKQLR